jgi:hypothetical protein
MRFLQISKWDERQHYHDGRRPTWIKFFLDLLNPGKHPRYAAMSDGAKLTLHHLWLLAAECDNKIPETWLTKDRLNMQTRPKVDEIVRAGYATYSSQTSSESSSPHVSVSVSPSSSHSEKLDSWQESAFATIWDEYPKRIGRKGALRHFKASVFGPDDLARLRMALANYLASGEVQRGFIQYGSTWFNNWLDWVTVDAPISDPARDEALLRDEIREAARRIRRDVKAGTASQEHAEYFAWLSPDGETMRDDAVTFDEWLSKREVIA